VSTRGRFRSFTEAREFARALGLKSETEWRAFSKHSRPPDIPAGPARVYRGSWQGWGDFLGTERTASQDIVFRPFEEAREFVRSLGLKSQREWSEWSEWSRENRPPTFLRRRTGPTAIPRSAAGVAAGPCTP